jgi:hypothetical protein
MAINIGGIDIADALINAELRLGVLERIVERLAQVAPPGSLSGLDIERFRKEAFLDLQKKYPQAGLVWKSPVSS